MLLLRQEQRKRKKEWAEKRKLWARKEKARHKEREREREERREDREHAVRGFVASVIDHEKRRKCSTEAHVAPIIVVSSDEQPPAVIIEGVDVATGTRTPGSSEIAIREGVLEPTYEENGAAVVIKDKDRAKRVKDKVREIKDEIKTLEEDLQVLGIQEKQDETPNARWVEGYWAFGRYIKKIAHAAQMKGPCLSFHFSVLLPASSRSIQDKVFYQFDTGLTSAIIDAQRTKRCRGSRRHSRRLRTQNPRCWRRGCRHLRRPWRCTRCPTRTAPRPFPSHPA